MSNILTLTDAAGNTIVSCSVNLQIVIDADDANVQAINSALGLGNITMYVQGNAVPTTANTTCMWTDMKLLQFNSMTPPPGSGMITIEVI